jgi:hypothetical protein
MDEQTILKKRDTEVIPHLKQYAPVWLVEESLLPEDDAVVFSVVFQEYPAGWMKRRYQYDGYDDVLYYLGENIISEAEAAEVQDKYEPYLNPVVTDVVNSYEG